MEMMEKTSYSDGRPWDQTHVKSFQIDESYDDGSVSEWMNQTFSRFKQYRRFYDTSWDRWKDIYIGLHWPMMIGSGWQGQARMTVNYSRYIVHEIVSTVLENDPEMQYISNPWNMAYANGLQAYSDSVMNRRNVNVEVKDALLEACQCGIGYLFVFWDHELDNGQGDISVRSLPAKCCYPQPGARRIDEMSQFMIHRQESRAWMEEYFPDKVDLCHASALGENNDQYGRRGQQRGGSTFGANVYMEGPQSQGYGYSGDDPLIADKTQFTNAPFKSALGFEQRYDVLEMWVKDASLVEKTYTSTVPRIMMDAYGNRFVIQETHTETRLERKYKTGWRHIQSCGRVTLTDEESPYDFLPIVAVYDMTTDNEFIGQGTIQTIEPLQFELNKRTSQAINHVVLNGGAVWKIDKNAHIEWESLNNLPAQIIKYRRVTGQEIVREAGVPLPAMFFQCIEMAIRNMKVIAGVEMAGMPQKGARSGAAVRDANAIATRQIRLRTKSMDITYRDMGRKFISLAQRFVTTPRWVMTMGNNNFTGHIQFDGRNIRGQWDILVKAGSSTGKEQQESRDIELYDKKIIDQQAVLERLNYPNYQAILTRMQHAQAIESQQYAGFPGMNEDSTEGSGYAASIRAQPTKFALPPPPVPAGSPNIKMPSFPQHAGSPHAIPMGRQQ